MVINGVKQILASSVSLLKFALFVGPLLIIILMRYIHSYLTKHASNTCIHSNLKYRNLYNRYLNRPRTKSFSRWSEEQKSIETK